MKKLILIILDGLNDDTAVRTMGFLQLLVESGRASKSTVTASLPTLSRPLYETILTGKQPHEHGVIHNQIVRKSTEMSLLDYVAAVGKTSAAAAYHWMSELYVTAPFMPEMRYKLDGEGKLGYGVFYYEDDYPDSHVFADADYLWTTYTPDFLLVHSMNIDDAGHKKGGLDRAYTHAARKADYILSHYISKWQDEHVEIIVTADHGMAEDGAHGASSDAERRVPFWHIHALEPTQTQNEAHGLYLPKHQTEILSYCLSLLNIGNAEKEGEV